MDRFGSSVSQSGNILAVGANEADPGGIADAGAVYLYQIETNGSATYLTKVTAPDAAANDQFGFSVSQSDNILAVGARYADLGGISGAGAAYLYQIETNGSATYLTKVTAPDGPDSDLFGFSVSQSGNILAVGASYADPAGVSGAGAAYLYRLEANGTTSFLSKVTAPDMSTNDQFGHSVSQSGNILAVGAHLADPSGNVDAGASYLYRLETNGSVTFLSKVTAPDSTSNDQFGQSVSQSGNILAVGAFRADPSGSMQLGATYIYRLEANGSASFLTKITAHNMAAFDQFGNSVSLYGNILAVGARYSDPEANTDAGATYLYSLEANGSATFLSTLTAPDKNPNDHFGYSVSQSGNILAVGSYFADPGGISNAGAVYTFDISDYIPNRAPTDLNSTASLTIMENQPIGTVVGDFNTTDPDGDEITY
ncbi:MAG: hypothetical protein VX130_06030, partial [Verrucomicrobiota bacterium]|nr:hypothetical protein [Verrucomicrobiota bacterium]